MPRPLPNKASRSPGRGVSRGIACVLGPLFAASLTTTQAKAENWHIVPQIGLAETYTNNVALAPSGNARQDWVTDIAPGLHIDGEGARVKAVFDYCLHRLTYANQPKFDDTLHLLNSAATVEAVENWLFVDARATISQLPTSAFGTVAPDLTSATSNRSETTVYQLSPYIRGRISDLALYQLRFNGTSGHSKDQALPETKTGEWIGVLQSAPSSARLAWSVKGNAMSVRNDVVGQKDDARLLGSLIYEVDPQFHLSVADGYESTDLAGTSRQKNTTPGFGFEWSPSPRTQVAAFKARRFFGEGHSLNLSHRTRLTAWRYTDTKDVAVLPNLLAANAQSSISGLLSDLLTASIPDPTARAAAVKSQLQGYGAPILPTAGTYVTSSVFVSRRREASVALLGATNTVAVALVQDEQHALAGSFGPTDSFAASPDIRQLGVNASWQHRLSPLSSLNLFASRWRTQGRSGTSPESRQNSLTLAFSTQVGPRTVISAGARRVLFSSSVYDGYHENAVMASLSIHF